MNPRYPYERKRKYPHLLPSDAKIWDRFIEQYPNFFAEVEYDVHVGQGIEIDPAWPEPIARMATILTQRRIDVIGYRTDSLWIIELKQDPGISVIGQLLGYPQLYKKENNPSLPITTALIANRIDRDIKGLLLDFDIEGFEI